MKRLGLFAILALAAATRVAAQQGPQPPEQPDFQITAEERAAVIEGSIAKLNESYVYPEIAKKMESALRSRVGRGEYRSITSANALTQKLTEDLREVSKDEHLKLVCSPTGAQEGRSPEPSPDELRARNYGFEKVELMDGNIGYVDIRGFAPTRIAAETASAAMTFVANTDALIIDLRKNGGGDPTMVSYVLSYLFDQVTHVNDLYSRFEEAPRQWWTLASVPGLRFGGKKPVYVLTSHYTFSAGEEFANDLKTQKRAQLIGEATGGGSHPARFFKVTEHFTIKVPFARAINPITRTDWEGVGVVPDVAKPADEALTVAYRMAVEKLAETATDPESKEHLSKLLQEKKN